MQRYATQFEPPLVLSKLSSFNLMQAGETFGMTEAAAKSECDLQSDTVVNRNCMAVSTSECVIRRYLLCVEYVGTAFSGSQKQPDGVSTIQGAIEQALHLVTKQVRSTRAL